LHTEGDSPGGNSVAQIYHPVPAARCSTCGMCASASEALYGTGVADRRILVTTQCVRRAGL